jgi:hypothetical protein
MNAFRLILVFAITAIVATAQTKLPESTTAPNKPAPLDVLQRFYPSGAMGDGELGTKYMQIQDAWREKPHTAPTCVKVTYTPGPAGWCGLYWQNKPNNWGAKPGEDLSKQGFSRITFWARGETGNEIVEFKAGGIDADGKPNHDSFERTIGKASLTKDWKSYSILLDGQNLSSVIGAFCFAIAGTSNPAGATFYIDDVFYE